MERNINNLIYTENTTHMTESEEELKSLLMRMKEENEKAGLKFNIKITKIMANEGGKVEAVTDFLFLGSKITEDGDCSQDIRRRLLLGRKAMTNLDSVLKSKDVTLSTEVRIVKAIVFPVVTYGCESWTIKKAEAEELTLWNCGAEEDS